MFINNERKYAFIIGTYLLEFNIGHSWLQVPEVKKKNRDNVCPYIFAVQRKIDVYY